MKTLIASIVLLQCSSLLAHSLPSGVEYSRPGTQGEYPGAYMAKKTVVVNAKSKPGPAGAFDRTCELKAGKKIILAKEISVITQTYSIGKFLALKDFQVTEAYDDSDKPVTLEIKAGELLENLSYQAEGSCTVRVHGKEFVSDCIGLMNDGSVKELSEFKAESWVKLKCANGSSAWIGESHLTKYKAIKTIFYNPYSGEEQD